jgi:S-adenosylmethionine:tRNA ribosyltransferase-isomerase
LDPADALRRTGAYVYDLPPERIARTPAEPADAARLLVVRPDGLEHRVFREFPSLLRRGDVLVVNETRVIRARLHGTREPGGGAAEVLLLRPLGDGAFDPNAREWEALVKPGRRLPPGAVVRFGEHGIAHIVKAGNGGSRVVRFDDGVSIQSIMDVYGELPLPPYVGAGDDARAARYQTMFARVPGSVAAPTASLHFTPKVMEAIVARGVLVHPLVLDVGYGTFKPIESETIDDHAMHAERYNIPQATAAAVNAARAEGRRVVVAGTTALRALEASARGPGGAVAAGQAQTDIFITPGFRFAVADALLTNFHLPASTLLVLVSAFAGYERVRSAYRTAVECDYRFFSFGDAMFLFRDSDPEVAVPLDAD